MIPDQWQRLDEDEYGVQRPRLSLSISRGTKGRTHRIEMFCRTRRLADEGRACLSLAIQRQIPAMTADRAWNAIDVPIQIVQIRA